MSPARQSEHSWRHASPAAGYRAGWSDCSSIAVLCIGPANQRSTAGAWPSRNTFSWYMVMAARCPLASVPLNVTERFQTIRSSPGPMYSFHAAGGVNVVPRMICVCHSPVGKGYHSFCTVRPGLSAW